MSEERTISVLVDDDANPEAIAELLAALSATYRELSGGDELIIGGKN